MVMKTDRDAPEVSIVVPMYDEASNVSRVVEAIGAALGSFSESYELLLVDDGSRDRTWQEIREAATRNEHVQGLRFSRNFGKEAAIFAGLEACRGEAIIVLDADLQHPPELIGEMLGHWRGGADIVEAVRASKRRGSYLSRIRTALFYDVFNRLSGFELANHSDFKLLSRRVVDNLLELQERGRFFRGLVAWLGFERVALPFEVPPRNAGSSKFTLLRLLRLATNSITSFSSLPLHLSTLAGAAFALFAFGLSLQTLYNWITGYAVSGFTTVILLQLASSSLILLSLGIVGEYLAQIYREVKRRPSYVIREKFDGRDGHQ